MSGGLTKDRSIWKLLAVLADRLGDRRFQVVDHWDADLFAIGVARTGMPTHLVYLSTFNQPPGHYSYECEQLGAAHLEASRRAEGVSIEQLLTVVREHIFEEVD